MTAAIKDAAYLSIVWCNNLSQRNGLFELSLEPSTKRLRLDEGDNLRQWVGPSVAQLSHQDKSQSNNHGSTTSSHRANSSQDNLQARIQMGVISQPFKEIGESAATSLALQQNLPNAHVSGTGLSQPTGQALFVNSVGKRGQANLDTGAYRYWLRSEPFRTVFEDPNANHEELMPDEEPDDDSTIEDVVENISEKSGVRGITSKFSDVVLAVVRQRQAEQTGKSF